MNPTLPISRFKDPEPEGQSVAAEPTAEPADALGHVLSMTPEERRAQACKQMARASLPLDASEAWRADLEAYSAEVLKSKHRDVLERRAEAKRRTEADRLAEDTRRAEAVRRAEAYRRAAEGAQAATESSPRKEYRPRTEWAKKFQLLAAYPHPPRYRTFTCGARTRAGTPCKVKSVYQNGRCQFHGGLSTGPKTEQGRRQSSENGRKGGRPRKPVGSGQEPKS